MNESSQVRCLVRGGGDLATGAVWRLQRAGFGVIVTELPEPMTVRRTVAVSTAVTDEEVCVEGMVARRVPSMEAAVDLLSDGPGRTVPVVVAPDLPERVRFDVVVDARMAKRNIDTSRDDADLVVALGPGFTAGLDAHAVVETLRGPRLGRVLWSGAAAGDTGVPGVVGGRSADRVVRAPADGQLAWSATIGDRVGAGDVLGHIGDEPVRSAIDGLVRGLIAPGFTVAAHQKIGDVDPRLDVDCDEISDKALAIGGGVLEATTTWLAER
ncbi:MAG: selenium-dependent molybdenum cofactor biosynthesis protein YqeB [Acidimicrobiales bacterium]